MKLLDRDEISKKSANLVGSFIRMYSKIGDIDKTREVLLEDIQELPEEDVYNLVVMHVMVLSELLAEEDKGVFDV